MEEDGMNFFARLRKLCHDLDKNIDPLKESLSQPARNAPHLYDRGLNMLKKEVQDLKTINEDAKKTQRSVQTFSNWLQSMQEFIDSKEEEINKLEKYLVKFGYVPMERPVAATSGISPTLSGQETTTKEHVPCKKDIDSQNVKFEAKSQSAATSSLGIRDHQGPGEKSEASADDRSKKERSKPNVTDHKTTPASSQMRPSFLKKRDLESCTYGSNSVTVEQWLEKVENCGFQVTPDVVQMRRVPMREKLEVTQDYRSMPKYDISEELVPDDSAVISESSVDPQTPIKNSISTNKSSITNVCNTPVEPELSEYTTQFLKSIPYGRLNKPSFQDKESNSNIIPSSISGQCDSEEASSLPRKDVKTPQNVISKLDKTPEEPVLSYLSADLESGRTVNKFPEEPVLTYQPSKHGINTEVECRTPEEPVLSSLSKFTIADAPKTRTPEEPVLSTQVSSMKQSAQADVVTPEEPLLSYQFYDRKSVNTVNKGTPEEPVLSGYASAMLNSSSSQSHLGSQNDIPVSPELSDITRSLLSLQNKMNTNQYSCDTKPQFSRNGKLIPQTEYNKKSNWKGTNENVHDTKPTDNYHLHRPSTKVEKLRMDELPPSPQLSETTMRLLSLMK
ncbi:uncharacterized protein [Palaemon carinicauda]|uniref:uncharacterized protein n=1 Tax=Palaemon carinicauda TaxID=392227 RepID=UPI0035B59578